MGGVWSGRWGGHQKATCVEDCRVLDLGLVVRESGLQPHSSGVVRWLRGDEVVSSVGYQVLGAGDERVLRVHYRWTNQVRGEIDVDLRVPVETTPLPRGGVRWWGRCPVSHGGETCHRRVGKLYLPPGSTSFGCRTCHGLTYETRQTYDKRAARLLDNPDRFSQAAGDLTRLGVRDLLLLLKASRYELGRHRARCVRSAKGQDP